jgi:CheY-like chemotaxis protein
MTMERLGSRPPSILVVDDEPALRSALAFDFELRDFRVLQADHGERAMGILESDRDIDIVLTDVLMPVMGGVELLERIRASTSFRQPGVVFLTGYSELTLEDAHHRGADAFFGKPFERSALIRAVDRLLLPVRDRWKSGTPASDTGAATARRLIQAKITEPDSHAAGFRLGHGGFFLSLEVASGLYVGQDVDVQVELGGVHLEGTVRVLWVRTPTKNPGVRAGSGLEWLSLTEPSIHALLEVLGTQRLKPYVPRS